MDELRPLYEPLPVSQASEPWRQGYGLGASARQKVSSPGPLMNVQAFLENLGVHVAFVEFSRSDLEAASIWDRDSAPVILLNRAAGRVLNPLARRSVLAHELCHLLHDSGEHDLTTVVSKRDETLPVEQRAAGFAPSFIAPCAWLRVSKKASGHAVVRDLAQTWGLSHEGAAWHAKNCDRLTAKAAEALIAAGGRVLAEGFEEEVPRTPPDLVGLDVAPTPLAEGAFAEVVLLAHSEGVISRGRARELLGLS